jgi:transposase
MILLPDQTRIYLAIGSTDMRKSINGLSQLVAENFIIDVFSGRLFAFCNRRRNIIKILFWDRNGFCLWLKRLEKDRFHWPESASEVLDIDSCQLSWLLAGLDIGKAHKQLSYDLI